jgi:hypothetical protein
MIVEESAGYTRPRVRWWMVRGFCPLERLGALGAKAIAPVSIAAALEKYRVAD